MTTTPVSLPIPTPVKLTPGRALTWLAVAALATAAAGWLAQDEARQTARQEALAGFAQQVAPAADGPAQQALAARYLQALPAAERERLSEQVREEQRAGTTAAGSQAFVLRRLALYEAALQGR